MTGHRTSLKEHHRRRKTRRLNRRLGLAASFGAIIVLLALLAHTYDQQLAALRYELSVPRDLPAAQPRESGDVARPEPEAPGVTTLPEALNIDVPFTSQAPHGNWDPAHEEYCEEASVAMVARFFANTDFAGPDDADQEMQALHTWQTERFGYFESTTAAETKEMIEANYDLSVVLETNVTAQAIKEALAAGNLVIVPAAGQKLGNPFFTQPGPIYHMLVVKGYTAQKFITNDPGTKRGADYLYDYDTLLNAVGDYNHGDPENGQSVLLIVSER